MNKNFILFMCGCFLFSAAALAQNHTLEEAEGMTLQEHIAQARADAQHLHGEQQVAIITSNLQTPQAIVYEVVDGDTIGKIARKYQTTIELIKISNHLTNHIIRTGQKLRIWTAPFVITIDKSDNILIVTCNDQMIKIYQVATGTDNITPVGDFTIDSRLENPTWFKKGEVISSGSPENALGTRWLGFDKPQYGIHGTIHPELIGQQVSHGCVRMRNEDVEELFNYIPIGAKVIIRD